MSHIFHFLQSDTVFSILNLFGEFLMSTPVRKATRLKYLSCCNIHWRQDVTIFLPGEFWLVNSNAKWHQFKVFTRGGIGCVSLVLLLIDPRNFFTVMICSCLPGRLSSTRCTSTSLDSTLFSTNQRKEAPGQTCMKWTRITCAPLSLLKRNSWP